MPEFNVRAELDARFPISPDDIGALVDPLMDLLEDFGGTVGRTPDGRPELILTVNADTVWQATTIARGLIGTTGYEVLAIEVMPQDEFARRSQAVPLPPLVSVPQAAELLGVTRQAVLDRVQRGRLAGVKVGDTWVLPRHAVAEDLASRGPQPAEVVTYQ